MSRAMHQRGVMRACSSWLREGEVTVRRAFWRAEFVGLGQHLLELEREKIVQMEKANRVTILSSNYKAFPGLPSWK